ncbi:ribosome biogenesis GTPase Der [bacterium]|nr:MAG: ribosome biogenesis GTPase Der [bacterium]
MKRKLPTVAIVGRPNVGKSTFFNRLLGERKAIVDDQSGVTRDRHYAESNWNGRDFTIIDTGGYVPEDPDSITKGIRDQVHLAINEADVLLFIVDVEVGITDLDRAVSLMLKEQSRPVIVCANKSDNEHKSWQAPEFYGLGFEKVFPISAISGLGTGDLLDEVVELLPDDIIIEDEEHKYPRLALIGRPNVGKSSLLNALLKNERSIVSEVAGTTRDSINSFFEFQDQIYELVDTAGLRKRTKVNESIEFYSTIRTQKAIRECDVALLLIDAVQGLEAQDIRVMREAEKFNKGIILVINKWDLVEKETNTLKKYIDDIYTKIATLKYIPVVSISALTGQRVTKVMEMAETVIEERKKKISTSKLNAFLEQILKERPLPLHNRHPLTIKYGTQVKMNPPVFAFFMNKPKELPSNYRRYIEAKLRENFGFVGVPVTMVFKEK